MIAGGDICYSPVEHVALLRGISDQMWQFGILMLVSGFVLGYCMPRLASYIKVKYGRAAE
jgi:hypothetical protein